MKFQYPLQQFMARAENIFDCAKVSFEFVRVKHNNVKHGLHGASIVSTTKISIRPALCDLTAHSPNCRNQHRRLPYLHHYNFIFRV